MEDVGSLFAEATVHHQAGRLAEADGLYRRILAIDPRHADSLHRVGLLAGQVGRFDIATSLIGQAIALDGSRADYHLDLGNVRMAEGKSGEAEQHYLSALAIAPSYPEALNNLGSALLNQGRKAEAAQRYEAAIALAPGYAQAHYNLAKALDELGSREAAVARYEQALAIAPDLFEARNNLGAALIALGRSAEAQGHLEQAVALQPDDAEANFNLGAALQDQGALGDAVLRHRRALAAIPRFPEAHEGLAKALQSQGFVDEALGHYRQALASRPDFAAARSNYLLTLNYSDLPAAEIFAEHRRQAPAPPPPPSLPNVRDANRRLRVGYVSPDFRSHSVAWFFEPLLGAHDPASVEVFCYAEVPKPDAVTQRLQGLSDHWRPTVGLSDEAVAALVRADGIDVLVDLAGHTGSNRLGAFALKPAPVQVSWLGYPNTTGLAAMDYRLVDAITDPPGEADALASESLVRLDGGFLCYGPPPDAPEPAPPPSQAAGFITFGSFNNPAKLSAATLDAWAAILARVPGSRLLLKGGPMSDTPTRDLFQARLAERGVAPERVRLLGRSLRTVDHLGLYGNIDIGLDPFPYNGTTTTCEALWMAVPVVALLGDHHAARVSASILTRVGLESLIARDAQDYVEIAVALAADPARLADIRGALRPRMAASPLRDATAFAAKVEHAYRQMWRAWCAREP